MTKETAREFIREIGDTKIRISKKTDKKTLLLVNEMLDKYEKELKK